MNVIDSKPYEMLIGGRWQAGREGLAFDTLNPATAKPLAQVHQAHATDVDAAVQAAHAAFENGWGRTTPAERGRLLRRLAVLFERDREKLAWIETLNVGKPITHSRESLKAMPSSLEYFAGMIAAVRGETIAVGNSDVLNYTIREPLGVCALIMPWNYPMTLTINKLGPALAAGNTIVLKPSEVTPLSTLALARLFEEAGFPPGVVNVVNGPGATVGEQLVTHPLVSRVSFTGGTVTGARILATTAGELKRVTLELGGKSPLIVFDDASLDKAVAVAAGDIIKNSGQVCIACTRILVQETVHDDFLDRLQQRLKTVRVGAPEAVGTEMGHWSVQRKSSALNNTFRSPQKRAPGPLASVSLSRTRARRRDFLCRPHCCCNRARKCNRHRMKSSGRCSLSSVSGTKTMPCALPITPAMGWPLWCSRAMADVP